MYAVIPTYSAQCSLEVPSCGSCIRASTRCFDYRDTNTPRFNNETQAFRARAATRKTDTGPRRHDFSIKSSNLSLDLLVQARSMFFGSYITDFCRAWDFLYPYFQSTIGPDHLMLSIDAVSLAFLSHQVTSPSAQQLGRRKYISALRKINAALDCPRTAHEATTLQTSLLLDLFEKITFSSSGDEDSRRAHIDGALALVKIKGLDHFTDDAGLRVLARLLLNASVADFTQGDPVSADLREVRQHIAQFSDTLDPKWKMSGIVLEVTDLMSEMRKGMFSPKERAQKCIEFDKKLEQVSNEAPPVWSYKREYISANNTGARVLDDFYDVYSDRITTQRWNVLRIIRIFLCEEIVISLATQDDLGSRLQSQRASTVASFTIQEICASVPQMTDCDGAAQHKLPQESIMGVSSQHRHTLSHLIDAYILIYPLFTACWSRDCTNVARTWMLGRLDHIAEHFGIKEAKIVAEVVRASKDGPRVWPGEVYRLLGSYAFAA
jgi:hypothetical protein